MNKIIVIMSLFFWITNSLAQINNCEAPKMIGGTCYVGGYENASLYYSWLSRSGGGGPTFVKVNNSSCELEIIEDSKIVLSYGALKPFQAIVQDSFIYELSVGNFKIGQKGKNVYLVKRNFSDLQLVGEPKLIGSRAQHILSYSYDSMGMFVDDEGVFIVSRDVEGKKKNAYIKRLSLDLKELWSKDLNRFYPGNQKLITNVFADVKDKKIFLQLNLKGCTDCGFFQIKKNIKEVFDGVIYFDKDGKEISFIPSIPENIVYVSVRYFFNKIEDCVSGVYSIRRKGKNNKSETTGAGYLYCNWNKEDGSLLSYKKKLFTYQDVLTKETLDFINFLKPGIKYDLSENYPKGYGKFLVYELSNGDVLLVKLNIGNIMKGSSKQKSITTKLIWSKFFMCLSPQGNIKWTRVCPGLKDQNTFNYSVTDDNKFVFMSVGSKINYSDNGSFKLEKKSLNVVNNIYTITVLNLNDGEVLMRKEVEGKSASVGYNRGYCEYNNESNKYLVGLNVKSNKYPLKLRFTALKLE